jgi:peptidoglycan/LPS O-acetylase OafA/YrhL
MMLARVSLYLFSLGLLGFGVLFLVFPVSLTDLVGIVLPAPSAIMEVRGVYGGLFIGTALFLLLCARREPWLRPGVTALAIMSGGLVAGRTLGLIMDGPGIPFIYALLASEAAVLVMALLALRQLNAGTAA